jgi:ketosteroid isomerase-like protein
MAKMRVRVLLAAWVCAMAMGGVAQARGFDVETETRAFLDAYARGDRDAVLRRVDGDAVRIYGSDAAEVFAGRAGVEEMLADDMKLWGGAATIGPMQHVSTVATRDVATIFFDAAFSLGGRAAVPVRFAVVWRRRGGAWRVEQSSNVVPTVGQSGEELLRRAGAGR